MYQSLTLATAADLPQVVALYDAVLTSLERGPNWPGWRRDVYPTAREAEDGLAAGTLYLLRLPTLPEAAAATLILNRDQPGAYAGAHWHVKAPPERVMVVHTFMTHPAAARQGVGAQALAAAHDVARAQGCTCMRLDTYAGNTPARALYMKMGYAPTGLVDLGYGAYGLGWYQCYEFAL